MRKRNGLVIIYILAAAFGRAQNGSMKATFTPANGGKPVTLELLVPFMKSDNPHGYWFINPHTGDRHAQFQPDAGWGDRGLPVGFVTINEKENDFDVYDGSGNDSNQITVKSNSYVISAPEYNRRAENENKPLHVHITHFSASEFSFTFSGAARGAVIKDNATWTAGTVEGSGHFFREPKYLQTDALPGCDCDPTIYATVYDAEENIRTRSACETALSNKVFDAVQKAMAPLFSQVGRNTQNAAAAGDIDISMLPGHININVPVKDRPWCSSDYRHNGLTGLNAQKTFYSNEDGYGLRCIKIPSKEELNPSGAAPVVDPQRRQAYMDSIMKLAVARKITEAQLTKAITDVTSGAATGTAQPDYKRMEVEHNLYVQVIINPSDAETMLLKMGDKSHTVVQHNVCGSNYEIFSPMIKDPDGSWISNRLYIYLGRFEAPVRGKSGGGFDAETVKAVYPPHGNKLSIYNILIKLEGDKNMADKAIAHIDFDALSSLISKQ